MEFKVMVLATFKNEVYKSCRGVGERGYNGVKSPLTESRGVSV